VFLSGAVLMAFNLYRTFAGVVTVTARPPLPVAPPLPSPASAS